MMQLEKTVSRAMNSRQQAAIRRIDSENFDGVMRKVFEELQMQGRDINEEYLEAGVLALKQYYAIPIFDPFNMHAVSDEIDPFWHAHIIHTMQYWEFCDDLVGEYLHHVPLDHTVERDVQSVRFLYEYTIDVLKQIFSQLDTRFYPDTLADSRLVCTHMDIYDPGPDESDFVFPKIKEAQSQQLFPHLRT